MPGRTRIRRPTKPHARSEPHIILVVDDEPDIVEAIREVLLQELRGATVRTARSGLEALHVLEREPVDLIITDFKMPGMDGFELLSRADRIAPGIPQILMTAFVMDVPAAAKERLSPGRFVEKPFLAPQIVQAARLALAGAA